MEPGIQRAYIDANVILRYLTKDPPSLAEAARKVFADAEKGKVILKIVPLVVAEVVWVLESFYEYPKDHIAELLSQILLCDGLDSEDLNRVLEALKLYHEKNIDFADAFLAVNALDAGPPIICSFDRHFDRIEGIIRLEPGGKLPA